MCDLCDADEAAKVLQYTLKSSFLLKDQFAPIQSLLHELTAHIKYNDDKWKSVTKKLLFSLIVVFQKLTRFVTIHFVVKESAPRELPHLRKLRSLLCINGLQSQFDKLFSDLRHLIMDSPLAEKFSAEYIADIFSEDEVEVRKQNDFFKARDAMKKIKANVLKYMKKKHPEFVEKIKTLIEAFLEDAEAATDFSAFDRIEFIRLMPDVDDLLLLVNRNIEHVAAGTKKPRRKLQNDIPFSHLDLDSTTPQDEATALQLFDGNLGDFTYAFLKRNEEDERPVVVQKVSMDKLHDLSSRERLHFGYNLRQIEMNPADDADKASIVKGFGHVLHEDMIYIVIEKLEFNMAGLATGSPHVYTCREILHISHSLAKALSALHERGYVHGAVRPENVFFSDISFMGHVKLANFSHGLSSTKKSIGLISDVAPKRKLSKEEQTIKESKDMIYMAPEIIASRSYSYASDLYPLGMILWEMMQPGMFAFDYPLTPPRDLKMQILHRERPLIDFEIHKMQLPREEQIIPALWLYLSDMVQSLWEHEPWKRSSASFCSSGLKESKDLQSAEDRAKLQSVSFMGTIARRKDVMSMRKELDDAPPAPPPFIRRDDFETASRVTRATDNGGGRGSVKGPGGLSEYYPNYRPSRPATTGKPKTRIRVRSLKHQNKSNSNDQLLHDSVAVSHTTGEIMPKEGFVELLSEEEVEEFPRISRAVSGGGIKTQVIEKSVEDEGKIGFDGLSKAEIKIELQTFRDSLAIEGMILDKEEDFDLELATDKCLKSGLEEYHNEAVERYGRGLKRYADKEKKVSEAQTLRSRKGKDLKKQKGKKGIRKYMPSMRKTGVTKIMRRGSSKKDNISDGGSVGRERVRRTLFGRKSVPNNKESDGDSSLMV